VSDRQEITDSRVHLSDEHIERTAGTAERTKENKYSLERNGSIYNTKYRLESNNEFAKSTIEDIDSSNMTKNSTLKSAWKGILYSVRKTILLIIALLLSFLSMYELEKYFQEQNRINLEFERRFRQPLSLKSREPKSPGVETTDPAASTPKPSEGATTDPAASMSKPSEGATTDPAASTPKPSEGATTDPAASMPKPSEGATTDPAAPTSSRVGEAASSPPAPTAKLPDALPLKPRPPSPARPEKSRPQNIRGNCYPDRTGIIKCGNEL
jgi:hypothetical protein